MPIVENANRLIMSEFSGAFPIASKLKKLCQNNGGRLPTYTELQAILEVNDLPHKFGTREIRYSDGLYSETDGFFWSTSSGDLAESVRTYNIQNLARHNWISPAPPPILLDKKKSERGGYVVCVKQTKPSKK